METNKDNNSKDNKERRYLLLSEVRAVPAEDGEESRRVEGYAAVYNSRSAYMGFYEEIAPGAFDGVIEQSDVLALLNHSTGRGLLARSRNGEGSLELSVDDKGLRYAFDAPKTALGDELLEGLRREDITSSSFCFAIESERWDELEDGEYLRTIIKVKRLYDVSPVYHPAYPDTSVAARSLDAVKEERNTPPAEVSGITYNQLTL